MSVAPGMLHSLDLVIRFPVVVHQATPKFREHFSAFFGYPINRQAPGGGHVKPMEPAVHPKTSLVQILDLAVPADLLLEFLDYGFQALSHLAAHRRYRALGYPDLEEELQDSHDLVDGQLNLRVQDADHRHELWPILRLPDHAKFVLCIIFNSRFRKSFEALSQDKSRLIHSIRKIIR